MLNLISAILLVFVAGSVLYLYVLVAASLPAHSTTPAHAPRHSFAIAIPAHNEQGVIGSTVQMLLEQNYPSTLFHVFVVADHCVDRTAEMARSAGATCWERGEAPARSKGAALAWLFQKILQRESPYEAVVIFDADTRVDKEFLRIMDARLQKGARVVQGCHRILNPEDGWFPSLTYAMFLIDNRYQNQGRANLGWSAKNMGDSICFRADILQRLGWGQGLTEDYEFRQKLLLNGIKIAYEPAAVGYGEAPVNWTVARAQRARWLNGTFRASRRFAGELLRVGLRHRDLAALDGAAQSLLPSYSTLTLMSVVLLIAHLLWSSFSAPSLILAWGAVVAVMAVYPLIGLILERAPLRAYVAISLGPVFIIWRTALSLAARFGKPVEWVRTARRGSELPAPVRDASK